MTNTVLDLAAEFRAGLLAQDAEVLERLVGAYLQLYGRLKDKIDIFLLKYELLEEPTKAAVARLAQYGDLLQAIEEELAKYSAYAEVEISGAARAAIELAIRDTTAYLNFYGLERPAMLPTKAIEAMLGFLKPDGPLYARLGELAGAHAAKVGDAILEGVGLGYNPIKVAKSIENYMGGGLTDALRNARTVQLYSYREATRANYMMNSDVVQGWIWWAELDDEVCMACAAEHGEVHGLEENLDGHYNCRCAMLPYLGDNPVEQGGEEWFEGLSEDMQRQMMGEEKFEAWSEGKFDFGDLATTTHSDVFGDMRVERSLQELVGG
jgi:hypothetical protein